MYNYDKDFIDVTKRLSFSDREIAMLYPCIEEILTHDKWEYMRNYKHHMDTRSVHSLEVCCVSWRMARKNKCDETAVAIGALLHDFFLYDWQTEKINVDSLDISRKMYSPKMHGFMHPLVALDNAYKYFPHLMDEKIEDIIIKHMWPLTVKPPRYKEAWLVSLADKRCSLNVFKTPRELPKYLGFRSKKKKDFETIN